MSTVAAVSATEPLVPVRIENRDVRPRDLRIDAHERVLSSTVRYRFVIDAATVGAA